MTILSWCKLYSLGKLQNSLLKVLRLLSCHRCEVKLSVAMKA